MTSAAATTVARANAAMDIPGFTDPFPTLSPGGLRYLVDYDKFEPDSLVYQPEYADLQPVSSSDTRLKLFFAPIAKRPGERADPTPVVHRMRSAAVEYSYTDVGTPGATAGSKVIAPLALVGPQCHTEGGIRIANGCRPALILRFDDPLFMKVLDSICKKIETWIAPHVVLTTKFYHFPPSAAAGDLVSGSGPNDRRQASWWVPLVTAIPDKRILTGCLNAMGLSSEQSHTSAAVAPKDLYGGGRQSIVLIPVIHIRRVFIEQQQGGGDLRATARIDAILDHFILNGISFAPLASPSPRFQVGVGHGVGSATMSLFRQLMAGAAAAAVKVPSQQSLPQPPSIAGDAAVEAVAVPTRRRPGTPVPRGRGGGRGGASSAEGTAAAAATQVVPTSFETAYPGPAPMTPPLHPPSSPSVVDGPAEPAAGFARRPSPVVPPAPMAERVVQFQRRNFGSGRGSGRAAAAGAMAIPPSQAAASLASMKAAMSAASASAPLLLDEP